MSTPEASLRVRDPRLALAAATVAAATLAAACGSSGTGTTRVPETTGRDVGTATNALCAAGLRVTVDQTIVPAPNGGSGTRPSLASSRVRVTGTTPPAGSRVARGSVVVLHERLPRGVEVAVRTAPGCVTQVRSTTTVTAGEQAAIGAAARSPRWRSLAEGLPPRAAEEACVVELGTRGRPRRVPGTCSVSVGDLGRGGAHIVNLAVAWAGGSHVWNFLVQPHHTVKVASSGGPVRRVLPSAGAGTG